VEVPLGLFLAHVTRPLLPRYYSISSSPLLHPCCAHITAAVVDEITATGRRHLGVASSYLSRLSVPASLPFFIRKSTLRLPADPGNAVVMVGPGTGLAPFRGFLQHRRALRSAGAALGPALLFFGCRDPEKDYIYREELEAARDDGVLTLLSTAFSRVSNKKCYVQHRLLEERCAVFGALQSAGGTLFVCGDAKNMAKDVHKAVHDIAIRCNGCTGTEAEAWVAELQHSGRYVQDVW
jgi:NADPH-ferrihemoprotein reductase